MKTKNYFYGKNILVTGGTGMIGRPLVKILLEKKAKVTEKSKKSTSAKNPKVPQTLRPGNKFDSFPLYPTIVS